MNPNHSGRCPACHSASHCNCDTQTRAYAQFKIDVDFTIKTLKFELIDQAIRMKEQQKRIEELEKQVILMAQGVTVL